MKLYKYIKGVSVFWLAALVATLGTSSAYALPLPPSPSSLISSVFGSGSGSVFTNGDFSTIFEKIARSFEGVPGAISAAAYLTGIILAFTALIKLKKHIDDPNQTAITEVLARALIAGALFAMPYVVTVVTSTIGYQTSGVHVRDLTRGSTGSVGNIVTGAISSFTGADVCKTTQGLSAASNGLSAALSSGNVVSGLASAVGTLVSGGTLGQVVCYASHAFQGLSWLLMTGLYIAGLFLVFWGLLQLRDHIIDPSRMPANQPLKKLLVAGAFFAFPAVVDAARYALDPGKALIAVDPFLTAKNCGAGSTGSTMSLIQSGASLIGNLISGNGSGLSWNNSGASAGSTLNNILNGGGPSAKGGLDCMMVRFVSDLWGPMHMAIGIFCYLAGIILIALAVRRMLDNMDKGVKSPVGMGTIAMLLIGGALLSFDAIIRAVTVSLLPDFMGANRFQLHGSLAYSGGVCPPGQSSCSGLNSINMIITTVFAFAFLVGTISVLRGLFMLKEVANGGNASLMASFTHIIGGGMALNLGPVVERVQNSLGLQGMGIRVGTGPSSWTNSLITALGG